MKAERINKDQIRFTLTQDDLTERNIQVSELAYGSDKTKALFDEMMSEAYRQFGIDFSEKPLMIEAIPLSENSLTVTVTKVSGAAEIGSLFGANVPVENRLPGSEQKGLPGSAAGKGKRSSAGQNKENVLPNGSDMAIYVFSSYLSLSECMARMPAKLNVKSELYADLATREYFLVVHLRKITPEVRYAVSLLSQFADEWFCGGHALLLVQEQYQLIIKTRAIQKLSQVEQAEDVV